MFNSKKMKQLRLNKGYSQFQLYEKTRLKAEYISRLENGEIKDPRVSTICKLLIALDCNFHDLVDCQLPLEDYLPKAGKRLKRFSPS